MVVIDVRWERFMISNKVKMRKEVGEEGGNRRGVKKQN
jgi:hypothetical protein